MKKIMFIASLLLCGIVGASETAVSAVSAAAASKPRKRKAPVVVKAPVAVSDHNYVDPQRAKDIAKQKRSEAQMRREASKYLDDFLLTGCKNRNRFVDPNEIWKESNTSFGFSGGGNGIASSDEPAGDKQKASQKTGRVVVTVVKQSEVRSFPGTRPVFGYTFGVPVTSSKKNENDFTKRLERDRKKNYTMVFSRPVE